MKMRYTKQRQAVAPVIATLLMIAVAVAMSVIIFMWSQGFLSQTSSATGGQQGAQNQAAQSSISIETATFDTSSQKSTVIIRNVGAVAVTLGSVSIQGTSSNSGFKTAATPDTSPSCNPSATLSKGAACTYTSAVLGGLASGDVVNIKVTTNVGTFAQAQFTVP